MKTLFIGGTIYTMDPNFPHCQALAVENEKILAIGSNEEILTLRREEDMVVDLGGKTVDAVKLCGTGENG